MSDGELLGTARSQAPRISERAFRRAPPAPLAIGNAPLELTASCSRRPERFAGANELNRRLGNEGAQPVGAVLHARLLGDGVPQDDLALVLAQRGRVQNIFAIVEGTARF